MQQHLGWGVLGRNLTSYSFMYAHVRAWRRTAMDEEEEEKGCYWSSAASADPCLYSQLFLEFILWGCATVGPYRGVLGDVCRSHSDSTYPHTLLFFVLVFFMSCSRDMQMLMTPFLLLFKLISGSFRVVCLFMNEGLCSLVRVFGSFFDLHTTENCYRFLQEKPTHETWSWFRDVV